MEVRQKEWNEGNVDSELGEKDKNPVDNTSICCVLDTGISTQLLDQITTRKLC